MGSIQTERLKLIRFTLDLMQTTLRDKKLLEERLSVHVPEDWPLPDYAEALPYILGEVEKNPVRGEWGCIIVHSRDQVVIGDIGFNGLPDADGSVEIGYSIMPAYRKQGYAVEAAEAMVAWALAQPGVTRVTAECLPDNAGSIRVLEKLGMVQLGVKDNLCQWELSKRRPEPLEL